jgi:CBS domain containing-hemolysin-like protein
LVYNEDTDHMEWVVTLRELLQVQKKWNWNKRLCELNLWPVIKVPLTKPIHLLLDLFKKMRRHVAVVIDEYGWVAWLVSLEDVVEEVFGDIQDETDDEIEPIRTDGNWSYLFQSEVRFDEMLDKFDLDFDDVWIDEWEFDGETLWYFVMSYFERFPKKWDEIILPIHRSDDLDENKKDPHLNLRVMWVRNNKIWDIKVTIID